MRDLATLPPTLGIDPGQSGAIVLLANSCLTISRNFNTLRDISIAMRTHVMQALGLRVILEKVHAMPGQGVCSMFSFGRSTGAVLGAHFAASPENLPIYEVAPQTWQNWYRKFLDIPTGAGSFDSTKVASQIFSEGLLESCRKPRGALDHNATDAALIAYWGACQEDLNPWLSEHFSNLQENSSRKRRK